MREKARTNHTRKMDMGKLRNKQWQVSCGAAFRAAFIGKTDEPKRLCNLYGRTLRRLRRTTADVNCPRPCYSCALAIWRRLVRLLRIGVRVQNHPDLALQCRKSWRYNIPRRLQQTLALLRRG